MNNTSIHLIKDTLEEHLEDFNWRKPIIIRNESWTESGKADPSGVQRVRYFGAHKEQGRNCWFVLEICKGGSFSNRTSIQVEWQAESTPENNKLYLVCMNMINELKLTELISI